MWCEGGASLDQRLYHFSERNLGRQDPEADFRGDTAPKCLWILNSFDERDTLNYLGVLPMLTRLMFWIFDDFCYLCAPMNLPGSMRARHWNLCL